jgi:FkbM family methyltransferase
VKDFVRGRDILDIGAAKGDSLSVLSNYTDQRVVSYELIPETSKAARAVAETFPSGKHLVFNVGLSNVSEVVSVPAGGTDSSSLRSVGNAKVQVTTIDDEVKRLGLKVGLIKADVEGVEEEVVRGGLETIRRDRPVIVMSIYHNAEFVYLPKLLVELGYELRFLFPSFIHMHYEAIVIAVAPELESLCRVRGENVGLESTNVEDETSRTSISG